MESQARDSLGHLRVFHQEEPRTVQLQWGDGKAESVFKEGGGGWGATGLQLMFMLCCLRASQKRQWILPEAAHAYK